MPEQSGFCKSLVATLPFCTHLYILRRHWCFLRRQHRQGCVGQELSLGRTVPVNPTKSARSSGCQRGKPLRIRSASTSSLAGEPAGASVGRKSSVTIGTKSSSCPISKRVSNMFFIVQTFCLSGCLIRNAKRMFIEVRHSREGGNEKENFAYRSRYTSALSSTMDVFG